MIARICTKQKCKTVSPHYNCPHCQALTTPLPTIQLGMIGINGRASLHYTQEGGYFLQINKPSAHSYVSIEIQDLCFNAQPHLPHIEEDTSLMIMDTLKSVALMIAARNHHLWSGWVLCFIEALQATTDKLFHQTMLIALVDDIAAKLEKAKSQEDSP